MRIEYFYSHVRTKDHWMSTSDW